MIRGRVLNQFGLLESENGLYERMVESLELLGDAGLAKIIGDESLTDDEKQQATLNYILEKGKQ